MTAKKRSRLSQHRQMMEAFTAFLNVYWPLWRQHQHEMRYNDLLEGFKAGWAAA
jgi:hypothetical protein